MSDSSACPSCRFPLPPGSKICPKCGMPIGGADDSPPSAAQKNPWAFSLAELLIGTTYVCILLSVTVAFPEWGALLWVLSALALARTVWFSIAWKRTGKPFTPLAQLGSYVESLVVMALVAAAASVAFLGVCVPLGASVSQCCGPNYSDVLFWCAWIFGSLAGLASGGYVLWWLWIAPIVQWWRRGPLPTMLARLAGLARAILVLSSTFLASGTLAMAAGWAWVQSLAEEKRDERLPRIILFWNLLAGYIAGCILGIVAGRWVTRAGRGGWFWPILAGAALALIALVILAAFRVPPLGDDVFTPPLIGILVAFIVGLVIHRLIGFWSSGDDAKPQDRA